MKDIKLSEHFKASEFECRCGCGACKVNKALVERLEAVREHFGRPVRVNSGYRCPAHNAAVGGKPLSQHLLGNAADIVVDGISPAEMYKFADKMIGETGGVGSYAGFTHIDVRGSRARWKG